MGQQHMNTLKAIMNGTIKGEVLMELFYYSRVVNIPCFRYRMTNLPR